MKKAQKNRGVLADHFRKGKTFIAPALHTIPGMTNVSWPQELLPELIWLALLIDRYGFDRTLELASELGILAERYVFPPRTANYGRICDYYDLSDSAIRNIVEHMKSQVLHDLQAGIAPLLRLFPKCPMRFLFTKDIPRASRDVLDEEVVGRVLAECLSRHEKLPMLAQGAYFHVLIATGKVSFSPAVRPPRLALLKDYPKTEDSQREAGRTRAFVTGMKALEHDDRWCKYFWERGRAIGRCRTIGPRGILISQLSEEFLRFNYACFRRYYERVERLIRRIETNFPYNPSDPLRDEVLLGLACRIFRLTIQVVSFPANWTEDIGEVFLRLVADAYIHFHWFLTKASPADFQKFYEYGLGQQKLLSEHFRILFESHGISEDQARKMNPGIEFLSNHKMPDFINVNVGNWTDKTTRELAIDAGLHELYAFVYTPTSSTVHGMYDCLERHYLSYCINPFHKLHKVPVFRRKSPVSSYGFGNCLVLCDSALRDLLQFTRQKHPKLMPGDRLFREITKFKGKKA